MFTIDTETCVKRGKHGLVNYVLNTFYLRLYGIRHEVKDHSDNERQNPLPPLHGLLFPINALSNRIIRTTSFVTPLMEIVVVTRKLSVGPSRWIDQTTYCNMSVRATTELRLASYAERDKLKVQTKKRDYSHRMNWKEGRIFFYLTTLSTHFIYGYMASGLW